MTPVKISDATWSVDVDPEWPGFRGHFPGNPLVPAAEMIQWAIDIAESRGLSVTGVTSAKFLAPLRPSEQARVNASVKTDGLRVVVSRGEATIADILLSTGEAS